MVALIERVIGASLEKLRQAQEMEKFASSVALFESYLGWAKETPIYTDIFGCNFFLILVVKKPIKKHISIYYVPIVSIDLYVSPRLNVFVRLLTIILCIILSQCF